MAKFDDVMIKNMLDIPKAEREKYAEAFSEGNGELKEFLMFLWGKNINTIGCCAGHDENENDVPYICIDITSLNDIQTRNLLNILYINAPSRVSASLTNRFDQKVEKRFAIYFDDHSARFSYVHSLFESILKMDKLVNEENILKENKEKLETLCWAMNLDLKDYAESLVVPSVNFFEIQDVNCKESFVFFSICSELEGVNSYKELVDKIKNSNNFEEYRFVCKKGEKTKEFCDNEIASDLNLKILSARKGMTGVILNNEMIKENLKFLEGNKSLEKE